MRVVIDGWSDGFNTVFSRTDTSETVTLIVEPWTDEWRNGHGDMHSDRVSLGFEVLDMRGELTKVRVIVSHRVARVLSGMLLRHLHGFGGCAIGGSRITNVVNGS